MQIRAILTLLSACIRSKPLHPLNKQVRGISPRSLQCDNVDDNLSTTEHEALEVSKVYSSEHGGRAGAKVEQALAPLSKCRRAR